MKGPAWLRELVVTVVCTAVVVGVWLLGGRVTYGFREFSASLHAQLPLPARIVFGVAGFVATWWSFMFGAALAATVAVVASGDNNRR
jgi:type IV pilus assembly protein PilC